MRNLFLVMSTTLAILLVSCTASLSPKIATLTEQANSGNVEAQFELGTAYDTGFPVNPNRSLAKKWYSLAAENGHTEAQNSLGSIYQEEKAYTNALIWYEKAASENHALAINNLAYLYDLGLGVDSDKQKAFTLYRKSADLGWAEAMINLALMYGLGELGEKDFYHAYIWCSRAQKYIENSSRNIEASAADCLAESALKLSNLELNNAQKETDTWSPK